MVDCKRCARCGEWKPKTDFPLSKQNRDGRYSYCLPCKREVQSVDRAKHADKRNAYFRARYAADPEPKKAQRRKRYYEDPQRAVDEASAWNRKNSEKHAASAKKWQQANMQGLVREYTRRRNATRKGARAIKFSPAQLAQRAAYYGHRCWICRAAMTEWDHVKPLTKGGWHCLANLRPICRTCNAHKRNKWPFTVPTKESQSDAR